MSEELVDKIQEIILLREATEADLELLMAWRSNPLVFRGFYLQNEPLKWDGHYAWWQSRSNRKDWIIVLEKDNQSRDVGSVCVSSLNTDTPEVGVFIGEVTLWGKCIGRQAVILALAWLKSFGYKQVLAFILDDNKASLGLFQALGFRRMVVGRDEHRPSEHTYRHEL